MKNKKERRRRARALRPCRRLLTGECVQPVRLRYRVPGSAFVEMVFACLECIVPTKRPQRWEWHFTAEAETLDQLGRSRDIPMQFRPVALGRWHMADETALHLDVLSPERAYQAARFFGPRLGRDCVLDRARIVNHLIPATVTDLDRIYALLDQDVSVCDPPPETPASTEHGSRLAEELTKGGRPDLEQLTRHARAELAERRARGDDVPDVEDFPLHADEEFADFRVLRLHLLLRQARALRRWSGEEGVTLQTVIEETVAEFLQ